LFARRIIGVLVLVGCAGLLPFSKMAEVTSANKKPLTRPGPQQGLSSSRVFHAAAEEDVTVGRAAVFRLVEL